MSEAAMIDVKSSDIPQSAAQDAAQPDCDYGLVIGISMLVAVLVTTALLAAYHFWLVKPAAGFAVVDIASVVRVKEAEFTSLLSRPNVRDEDRQAAFQLVSRIGPEIEHAVGVLQKECRCTIVVKSAVIAGPAEDLTPRLKTLLGMSSRTDAMESGVKP
jgi:hypothetical protein